jgi:hypothetical protein
MSGNHFVLHIGIDYSGAETPIARLPGLEVYSATTDDAKRVEPPNSNNKRWTRQEIAEWLIKQAKSNVRFIAGIDHGFSLPRTYFERNGITSWSHFLDDFVEHWPTQMPSVSVNSIRHKGQPVRAGTSDEFRLTEMWTSSAKSVFLFDVQGSVAKSTHAGIPWLHHIRQEVGEGVHFWPFDGWQVSEGKSVIAEVYPSIFRNRYRPKQPTKDQQDAYAISRWLKEMDERDFLMQYFDPPLTEQERKVAELEGWILGIA